MKHILKAQQFDRDDINALFDLSLSLEQRNVSSCLMNFPIMATLFYEPSTRTRFSFESAMLKMGGKVLSTENAQEFSSAAKGEILEDTIRVVSGYSDVIVLRHSEEGSAERAANVSSVPIINAGDGIGQHPTQTLTDLYTIQKECGEIDGKTFALIGDLAQGRTVHSLAYMLTKYDIKHVYLVSPDFVKMKSELLAHFDKHEISWSSCHRLKDIASDVDVFYQTRIQKERFRREAFELFIQYQKVAHQYKIDANVLKMMKPTARILHPLPRLGEIALEIDSDPRAAYFRQAQNGLYIRMALLLKVLNNQ